MALMSLNDFLVSYYKQYHFDQMPAEVRARFDDYAKRGDFKGDMKKWNDELKGHDLPDPNDPNNGISDEDWEKLFNIFNTTLGRMKQDSDGLEDNKQAEDFVNEYYGNGKLFDIEPVDGATENEINNLKNNLHNLKGVVQEFLPDDMSFDKFQQSLNSGKYNTDAKFRNVFLQVIERLDRAKQWGVQNASQATLTALNAVNTERIANGFEQKPNPGKLASFKQEYKSILNRLHDKSKLREMFGNYDDGKLSKQIAKALKKVNYDDNSPENKSYVHPKTADELTLFQKVKKWVGDTYEDCLEKYTTLRGDRLFFSEPAQMICKAIDKAKIKPYDGIAAVLSKADDIKKGLKYKSPAAMDHFDWFVKEMNILKDAMPKAFEGALKNGPQLRHIIEKMIVDAVEQNKIKEAKTAMEVLSVIKYANTTSKIMDTIKEDKELFTLMSNKDLSWNKNAGIQFVTSALDKSVRAAFIGLGYGATMAINGIRKSRSKIRRPGKLLNKAHEDWKNSTAEQKQDTEQIQQDAQNRKGQSWNDVHNARRKRDIESDVNQASSDLQQTNDSIKTSVEVLEQFVQQQYNNGQQPQNPDVAIAEQYIADIEQYLQNPTPPIPPKPTFADPGLQNTANILDNDLQNLPTQQSELDTKQAELQDLQDAIAKLRAANNQIADTKKKLDNWDDNHTDKYDELINFWNRLETGRDSHMGEMYSWRPGSAKKKQEAFWAANGGRGI